MFKAYLSLKNSEFNETIKTIKSNRTQYFLDKDYSHTNLMTTAAKTYNNTMVDGGWELVENPNIHSQKGGTNMQAKFLALTAQVEELTKENGGDAKTEGLEEVRWRYLNSENKN